MSKLTLSDVAEKMRGIDIAFLSTKSDSGEIASRPMSSNGNVEYDGDSYFTLDSTQTVTDIKRDAKVSLAFSGKPGLLSSAAKFYASVEGDAELIRDKAEFEERWASDLDAWFKEGVDTPGLVLIKVSARRIKYWNGYEEGELEV